MGLEVRDGRVVFHYALRRRRFEPGEIIRSDLEHPRGNITGARSGVVMAQTVSDGKLRVPTLTFVAPGWRERVFGGAALAWDGGSSPEIELVLNRSLNAAGNSAVPVDT